MCHLANLVPCFKTYFIGTLNASKDIFVGFNLNCGLPAVFLSENRLHGCQIFRRFGTSKNGIRTNFQFSAHPYFLQGETKLPGSLVVMLRVISLL